MKFISLNFPIAGILFAMIFGGLAGGCASPKVQPWERATLMSYPMRTDRDPLARTMAEHTWFSREGSAGGSAVGGSGCGCN
ncbi:MAG: DUF4266 domain-containing protein [Lacunisphaera sp.]